MVAAGYRRRGIGVLLYCPVICLIPGFSRPFLVSWHSYERIGDLRFVSSPRFYNPTANRALRPGVGCALRKLGAICPLSQSSSSFATLKSRTDVPMLGSMQVISLHCHPDVPCTLVRSIKAVIGLDEGNTLSATYTIEGAIEQLLIPSGPLDRTDLWRHTCFELFVGATNDAEYYEFNFSPSGEWAVHGFRSYRDGGPIHVDGLEPKIAVQRGAGLLQLSAVVPLDSLAGVPNGVSLSVGLSAVVEDRSGALSYWALKHPPGKPDFHHADNFAVQVDLPMVDSDGIDDTAKP